VNARDENGSLSQDTRLSPKRVFDIGVSALLLIAFAPLLAALTIALVCAQGRPILFCQQRSGRNGRLFTLRKFRTMEVRTDVVSAPDDRKLTPMGHHLRRAGLDELPQLWNVLIGEMSLVGPRPLLPEYLPLYTKKQARRHAVKPGLTGWAQVNGRTSLDWSTQFDLDVWYVDNRSMRLDMRILLRSVAIMFRGADVKVRGKFNGRSYPPGDSPR
jgi:lipopolysaccharide/colanic/teichoic acid biosynthesis glycosyltransferase